MKRNVAVDAIFKMINKETPYDSDNIVLEIKGNGIYAGLMSVNKDTSRPVYESASWIRAADKDKIIFP